MRGTSPSGADPASILLVDDDEQVRDTLRAQLEGEGFAVTSSADGPTSLPLLRERMFAVIISDQRMPGMSGLELLAHARELQPTASRILITGLLSTDTLIRAINEGEIHRFLAKPWTRAELVATVRNAVNRHLLTRSNEELRSENARLSSQVAAAAAQAQIANEAAADFARQLEEAREAMEDSADCARGACFQLLTAWSPLLARRTQAVLALCRAMAEAGNFSEEETRSLLTAASLHGAGLLALPHDLALRFLAAPEQCGASERAALSRHPVEAQSVAAFVDPSLAAGEIVRANRERWDGRGYPDGLSGACIPWLARCLAVAVAFSEKELPSGEALVAIERGSGTAFDPEAVRLLQRAASRVTTPRPVREIALRELRPGMRLARSFTSPTGLLLLPEGHEITAAAVEKIRTSAMSSESGQRLLIYG